MDANFFYYSIYDRFKSRQPFACMHAFVNFYFKSISSETFDWIFSSPEHNSSGGAIVTGHRPSVRPSICPSVNNFFKNLLLQNPKANLDKTWQECSLGEALQKLLKEFNSNKNSGCHGNKMAENGKNL